MKKILIVLLVLSVLFLTSCVEKPYEECLTNWDYKIQERKITFVSYSVYLFETEHGDVEVSKKIYENGLEDKYKEICVLVEEGEETLLVGATFVDGTPEDKNLIEEITDQVVTEEDEE